MKFKWTTKILALIAAGALCLAATTAFATEGQADAESAASSASSPAVAAAVVEQPAALPYNDIVDYIFLSEQTIVPDSIQNVLVAFTDTAYDYSTAALTFVSDATNAQGMIDVTAFAEDVALFQLDTTSLSGSYTLTALTFKDAEGKEYVVDLTSEEAPASFTVAPEDDMVTLSEDDYEVTTFAMDDEGNLQEFGSIQQAMAASEGDMETLVSPKYTLASPLVIAIDAGHGGKDGGADSYVEEAYCNLTIAQACAKELSTYYGAKVIMTRTDDTYIALKDRVSYAMSQGANVVVSLHCNSSASGGAKGCEAIVPREGVYHTIGTQLAEKILGHITKLGIEYRSVYSRDCDNGSTYDDGSLQDYHTLVSGPREHGVTGIIVEHAFVSNASDGAFLAKDSNLKALGVADATGIAEYFGLVKNTESLYKDVYDYDYYIAHNEDVAKAFDRDRTKTFQHFLEYGMKEGRQGCEGFDVKSYKNEYPDLRAAYGTELPRYYGHYIQYGKSEGRHGTGCTKEVPAPKPAEGVVYRLYNPYAPGGDHHYTIDKAEHDNLVKAGWRSESTSDNVYGVRGTQAADTVPVYREYNPYAKTGTHNWTTDKAEHDSLVKAGWKDEGVAWYASASATAEFATPVYRLYNPYTGEHFYCMSLAEYKNTINAGWNGESEKSVASITKANSANIKGDKPCWYGATGEATEFIMGTSKVTVAQMVTRYGQSGAKYPSSVYTKYGAPDIKTFCTILLEEANAEGVRAEVVFAQAMVETGWLKFGGDVQADQCNFAGLGATGSVPGNSFNDNGKNSVRIGLRAQIQHLKAYASTDDLNNACVDQRFTYVKRGTAPAVVNLAGTWAADKSYGTKLLNEINAVLSVK